MTTALGAVQSTDLLETRADHFIAVDELASLIRDQAAIRILDVRFTLVDGPLPDEYIAGHIPGALFVDLEKDLSGPRDPAIGSYPLPSAEAFEQAARSWGIRADTEVIAYSGYTGIAAGRLAWLLRWFGHRHVRVLDGGLQAWERRNHVVVPGQSQPVQVGDIAAQPCCVPIVDTTQVIALGRESQLVDVRARGQFHLVEPDTTRGGRRPGRIPGAINIPSTSLHTRSGALRSAADIRRLLADEGIDVSKPVATYCGGGVASAWATYVLRAAGIDARLFASSWSEYVTDLSLPVEVESPLERC